MKRRIHSIMTLDHNAADAALAEDAEAPETGSRRIEIEGEDTPADGTGAAAAPAESEQPADPAAEPEPLSELEQAIAGRDKAAAEKQELLEQYQRAQAEFENVRKRLARERNESVEYSAMGTIESLLPVLDDFERAMKAPGVDPEYLKGLELIHKRIFEVFTRAGLKPIDHSDGRFDPYLHHAVDRGPAETDEQDQTILDVYQQGYFFKDRVLRPSLVKVAVKD
jgi:molecular chaperone GrpE